MAYLDHTGSSEESLRYQLYSLTSPLLTPHVFPVLRVPSWAGFPRRGLSLSDLTSVSLPAHSSCTAIFVLSLRALLVALDPLSWGQTHHRHIQPNTSKPDPLSPPPDLLPPRLGDGASSTPWGGNRGQVTCIALMAAHKGQAPSSAPQAIRTDCLMTDYPIFDTFPFCRMRLPVFTPHLLVATGHSSPLDHVPSLLNAFRGPPVALG